MPLETPPTETLASRELMLTRLIDAPREKMGFHEGWDVATDELTALAQKL